MPRAEAGARAGSGTPPAASTQRLDNLARAFEALPDELQMVVGLRYEERCSFAEIAAILRISEARAEAAHALAMRTLGPPLRDPDGDFALGRG
jgi:DNA-directed RNA polymerase specialized sigma24 family protein